MHIKIIVQQVNKPNQDEKYLAYMAEILSENDLISGVKVYKPANVSNPKHTDEMRVVCSDIKDRYDSRGKIWEGVKTWVI